MNLSAYKSLYQFADIESAVQSFFVAQGTFVAPPSETSDARETWTAGANEVGFLTAYEAPVFQKVRPRVSTLLESIQPATNPPKLIADNNGALRCNLWKANLKFEIVTGPSYTEHNDLRARVIALCEMIAPMVSNIATQIGVNHILQTWRVNYCKANSLDTSIDIVEGDYASELSYELTFSIPPLAIAAVVE